MIPRVIHQTWKTKALEAKLQEWTSSWKKLNPTWQYKLWDDQDCERFIAQHYPQLQELYKSLSPVQRADLFRYAILATEGGFYADIDAVCSAPLDSFLKPDDELVVGVESEPPAPNRGYVYPIQYCQWAMGGRAKHPALERAVEVTAQNVRDQEKLRPQWHKSAPHTSANDEKNWQTIMMTGPGAWTQAIAAGLERGEPIRVLRECAFGVNWSNKQRCPKKTVYVQHQYLGSWKGGLNTQQRLSLVALVFVVVLSSMVLLFYANKGKR